MKKTYIVPVTTVLAALIFVAWPIKFLYLVDVVNFGQSGVIVRQIGERVADGPHPAYVNLGVKGSMIIGRSPSIPSKYRDTTDGYGTFQGHDHDLPDEVTIEWQLADLTKCDRAFQENTQSLPEPEKTTALKYRRESFFHLSGCQWTPRADRIFRKTLDLRGVKESEAFKKTGKRYPDVAGSRYTLGISIIIIEDQVYLETANGATNPWL